MRDVLSHRMDGEIEVFSVLSGMNFKGEGYTISSILIHEITTQGGKAGDEESLANLLCEIFSQQWNRCLKEEFVHSHPIHTNAVHPTNLHPIPTQLPTPSKLRYLCAHSHLPTLTNQPRTINNRTPRLKTNLQ